MNEYGKISFVIPCYRSELTVETVVEEIKKICNHNSYDFEILLVNDSSPDGVWKVIENLCETDARIKGIRFSKNFGQASAVMAGYRYCDGNIVVTMDDDGQSPIDKIPEMIGKLINDNYDVIYGVCNNAKFSYLRRLGSRVNALMAYAAYGRPREKRIVSINVMRKYIIEEIIKYSNPYTYLSGLVYRSTSNIGYYEVSHRERISGTTGYKLSSLMRVWMNGFTAFSIKPLQISSYIGFVVSFMGFVMGIITILRKLMNYTIAAGWSSTISIMLFLGGIILLVLGMIGEYLGRIYMCINLSPQYVVSETINVE